MSNVLPALSGAAAFFLLVRLLGKEEVGLWIIFLTAITLFDMVRSGLVQPGLVRSLSGIAGGSDGATNSAAWVLAGSVSMITALIAGISAIVLPEHVLVASALGVYAIVSLPVALGEWSLQARDAFGRIVILRSSTRIPFLAAIVILMLVGIDDQLLVYGAFLLSMLAGSILALRGRWARLPCRSDDWKVAFKALVRFGSSSLWTATGSNLLRSSDTMLIGALSGAGSAALYGLPLRILDVIELPVRSLVNVFFPRLSGLAKEGRVTEAWKEWVNALKIITLLVLAVAVGGIMLADVLVAVVGGEVYRDSATVLRWMFAFSVFIPLDRLTGIFLDALGHPGHNARKVWMMLAVNVVGDIMVLLMGLPLWCVAAVSILTFGIGCIQGLVMVRRLIRAHSDVAQDLPLFAGRAS